MDTATYGWKDWQPGDDDEAGDWYSRAIVGTRGNVLCNVSNTLLALREDKTWRGRLTFNEFTCIELIDGQPITDHDITATQEKLQIAGLRSIGTGPVRDAMLAVAREHPFHPIRDRLKAVSWDGSPRLDEFMTTYLGAKDSPYTRAVGRMTVVSMVARVYKPGCKVDHVPILEGRQGEGKSTGCLILAGGDDCFSDSLTLDLGNKDAMAHLSGKWVIEMAELSAMGKSDAAALKAFLTRTVDKFRPAYGRQEVSRPRQCVFIGTTNHSVYLRDETGGRRFWPVVCGRIDLDGLARDRDQILAEAVHRYNLGEKWWPSREFEREHMSCEQEARYVSDVWRDSVAKFVAHRDRVRVEEILGEALEMASKDMRPDHTNRIVTILQGLGWRSRPSHGKNWWVPTS